MTDTPKTRRNFLFGAGALGATAMAAACSPGEADEADCAYLSSADRLDIAELYSRHFYSLDGVTAIVGGNVDQNWADTFTADGEFTMVKADGQALVTARGTAQLVKTYATFLHTTRHWMNHLLILPGEWGVRGSCYILAMDIKDLPYRIIRTGLYEDQLVKVGATWKFLARKLILDASSPD